MKDEIFTQEQTWLRCIECDHTANLLQERQFKCPVCGGLYEVRHKPLDRSWEQFINIFDDRLHRSVKRSDEPKVSSGIWRFKGLIMPYLPDEYIVTLGEGNVQMIRLKGPLASWIGSDNVWLMMQGQNPTGSFKDHGGTVAISIAHAAGIDLLGCASTGDTSAMAAAYAAKAQGMRCVVFLPKDGVTEAQVMQLKFYGAHIVLVPGTFDDCMTLVRKLVEEEKIFPVNSLNPTRIEGHQATVFLATQYFHWNMPDVFVAPVGNGSNISSIGKGIKTLTDAGFTGDTARIIGCQTAATGPLYDSWKNIVKDDRTFNARDWFHAFEPVHAGETGATAMNIGSPVSWQKVINAVSDSGGAMEIATEDEWLYAVRLCGFNGIHICPQTGVALAGLKKQVQSGYVDPSAKVVVVSTATGLKFPHTPSSEDFLPFTPWGVEYSEIADIVDQIRERRYA